MRWHKICILSNIDRDEQNYLYIFMCHRATENTETFYKGFLCVLCGSVVKLSCNSAQTLSRLLWENMRTKRREEAMRARVEHFMTFFVKTFLLVNFVFGSLGYVFAANRSNPGLEAETMLWIAVATAIFGLVLTFREV